MEKVLDEVKKFITKPVTNLMEKEQNEEYKVSIIKAVVSAAVVALILIFAIMSGVDAGIKSYAGSYNGPEIEAAKNLIYQQLNLFGLFFQVLAIFAGITLGVALVLFVVAKLMKVEKTFKNSLALAANYSIYTAVAMLVYYLLQFINVYVAVGVTLLIGSFASYALKYAFKNSLGAVDDDKLVMFASVVVTVITIVGAIILYNVIVGIGTSIMSSIYNMNSSSLYNSYNTYNSMNNLNSINSLYNLY